MTAQHTRGPWDAAPQNGGPGHCLMAQVFGPDGKALATVEPTTVAAEASANARVMAAAPDLLASLRDMVDLFERHIHGRPGPDDAAERWDRARVAIAKAEGGEA